MKIRTLWIITCILLTVLATTFVISCEKEDPIEKALDVEDIIILEDKAGNQVEVDFNSDDYKEFRSLDITQTTPLSDEEPIRYSYINSKKSLLEYPSDVLSIRSSFSKAPKWRFINVPHYSQNNSKENPNRYYWCGHTALKCVLSYHGKTVSLLDMHEKFKKNSPGGYAKDRNKDGSFVSSMWDLETAAKLNYGFPNSDSESVYSISKFYQRLKDGVNYKKPMIIASTYKYSYGHFYPVVGYKEVIKPNGSIDYDNSEFMLRDVYFSKPKYAFYDRIVSVSTFYKYRSSNDILLIKKWNVFV